MSQNVGTILANDVMKKMQTKSDKKYEHQCPVIKD